MQSKLKLFFAAAALVGGTACTTTTTATNPDPSVSMSEEAMMAKMMKLATPGPEHAELARMVGTWDNAYKLRFAPDAPWTETKGTSEATTILGGRYVMEQIKFEMMGMPVEGLSIMGFDNMTGEYTAFWADTMGTWWTQSRGKADAGGTIDYQGEMTDMAGTRPFRMVVKSSGDTAHIDMFDTIPPAGEVLVMTVDSKKRAAPAAGAR